MLKKLLWSCCIAVLLGCSSLVMAGEWFTDDEPILTNDLDEVVGETLRDEDNAIRGGSYAISEGLNGVFNEEELEDTGTAWDRTTRYIKGVINYILGIVGLVALIYMLYHGYLAVTAGTNEDQLNKGMKGVKYAGIALVGLGLSWFFISLIFRLMNVITAG